MAGLLSVVRPEWLSAVGLTAMALPLAKRRNTKGVRGKLWTAPNFNADLYYGNQPLYCRLCKGEGFIPCKLCNESGKLARGGFAKRNMVRVASLVGTKWTSVTAIGGKWRHFLCVAKKGRNAKDGVAILSSTCGPVENRVRIEVPVGELKSRNSWMGGWTTLNDIKEGDNLPTTTCSACRGHTKVVCPRCEGLGQIGL